MSDPSILDARGPAAAEIAAVWWIMLILGTAVFIVVAIYLAVALARQPSDRGPRALFAGGNSFIILWGIAVPAVILTAIMALNVAVSDRTHAPPTEPELTVEVIGHKFWWEIRYPDHGFVTANELHVPAGQPVRLALTASDVIHAFWVPQLHGKIDLIPGHVNRFWIQADEAGEFRGLCTEYCGIQHAQMHFVLVASDPAEFEQWAAARQEEPPEPEEGAVAAGREVFEAANCAACHTIRGVSPETSAGPDLTDLGARRTLAAGWIPNTRDNLAAWILDPHAIKPGVRMPPTPLDDDELAALLDYLESLRPEGEE